MLLGLLSLFSLAGGVPDDLRRDGVGVLGCSSFEVMDEVAKGLPPPVQSMLQGADMLRDMADPREPVWFVLGDVGGRSLPTQIVFHMPEGSAVPGFFRMMPGSPRIEQEGNRVVAMLGPPAATTDVGAATLARFVQAQVADGCTVVAPIRPGLNVGLGVNRAQDVRVSMSKDAVTALPSGISGVFGPLVDDLESPAEPRRAPWASTIDTPELTARLNMQTDVGSLAERMTGQRIDALDKVVIEPGAEIAVWRRPPDDLRWAVVVPVRKPRTVRWWPGRIAKRAKKDGLAVERVGKAWGIETAQGWVWVAARRRRLLLSSNSAMANELRDRKTGTAWAEPLGDVVDQPGMPIALGPANSRLRGHLLQVGDDLLLDGHLSAPPNGTGD